MSRGFPDYTQAMAVDVHVDDPEFPPDYPDTNAHTKLDSVISEIENKTKIIGKPVGTIRERGTNTTVTGSMTTIVDKVITDTKYFHLAKILVTWSGTDEQHIKVSLNSEIVGEYYATAYVIDWFAWDVKILGDGVKKVKIEAQATSTGAVLIGFINGEEV